MTEYGGHEDVLPVSLHHINEVISCSVASQGYICVVDLILGKDAFHSLTV